MVLCKTFSRIEESPPFREMPPQVTERDRYGLNNKTTPVGMVL